MRQLCAEAAMYRGAAAGHRARFLRGCAGGDAPPGDGRPGMDEAPPGNRRTSVWDDEVADGPPSIPGQGIDKSQSRTGLGGAELQSQTGHQHPRSAGAAASVRALHSLTRILCPRKHRRVPQSQKRRLLTQPGTQGPITPGLKSEKGLGSSARTRVRAAAMSAIALTLGSLRSQGRLIETSRI